jgi:hypothetical protein
MRTTPWEVPDGLAADRAGAAEDEIHEGFLALACCLVSWRRLEHSLKLGPLRAAARADAARHDRLRGLDAKEAPRLVLARRESEPQPRPSAFGDIGGGQPAVGVGDLAHNRQAEPRAGHAAGRE